MSESTWRSDETMQEFSLLGGPLHKLGQRLGLVREGTNTIGLGLALGLFAWTVLMLLALLQGFGPKVFSLAAIALHIRLLIAIPLLFLCETWVAPEITEFHRYIVRSGLVREASLPALASAVRGIGRMKDSWLAEVLFLLVAFAAPVIDAVVPLPGQTGSWATILDAAGGRLTWVSGWYLVFCLPLFRFLLLRWLWRLGLWCTFLWRVKTLELNLIPTHSDGVGGLGYLEIVQEQFAPLILAISALFAAQFAESISSGTAAFESLYYSVPTVLLLNAVLFLGPLCIFASDLWICRIDGMSKYMAMASRYVNAFDAKWIQDEKASGESQLGTPDMQSLADLTNSVNVVRGMRPIPAGSRLIKILVASAIVPLLPLLLLKFPLEQVVVQLFQALAGR